MLAVQRLHGQLAQAFLQGLLRALPRTLCQGFTHQMVFDPKVGVRHPVTAGRRFLHALHKARVAQQTLLQAPLQRFKGQPRAQYPYADDQHQVAGRIHAQPGRVDLAHGLAPGGHRGSAQLGLRHTGDVLGKGIFGKDAGDHGSSG